MAVSRVCYCNRDEVQRAVDFANTVITTAQVDRAMMAAAETIEGELHRVFYPNDTTYKWDWPNYQYAYPWRLWFRNWDLVSATQVQSPSGTTIPLASCIFRPVNKKPGWPYTFLELDRSTVAAFGAGPTPQLAIWITGTWGFNVNTDPAGTLAAAITTTGQATCTVSDSSQVGAGDLLVIGSERIVVADKTMASTGISFAGLTTPSAGDNVVAVPDGTQFTPGEVLLFDAERCLLTEVAGNNLLVRRGWDGSVLAAHTSGTIYAARQLSLLRGQYGTTPATYSQGTAVTRHQVPAKIRSLGVAEAVNQVLQETSGYARTVGAGDLTIPAPGAGLAELWDEAMATFGRKARTGGI